MNKILEVNNLSKNYQTIEGEIKAIDNICLKKVVVLHTDATKAIGKIKIYVQKFESLKFLTFTL